MLKKKKVIFYSVEAFRAGIAGIKFLTVSTWVSSPCTLALPCG